MIPVVGLPGVLFGDLHWARFRRQMRRKFLTHSFPGFDGRARLPQHTPTALDYAEDLRYAMDFADVHRAHLFAHCSGCTPALAFANHYPERVASVTLVAYWHGTREWKSREEIENGVRPYMEDRAHLLVENPDLQKQVLDYAESALTDNEGMYQMARSIMVSAKPMLQACTAPLHFIVGTQDRVTSPEAQLSVAKQAGAAITAVKTGHCPHIEAPITVALSANQFWNSKG